MKIRCQANSLRFRLRKSDVEALSKEGKLRADIAFGLGFELYTATIPSMAASLVGGLLRVGLPISIAKAWMASDAVAIEESLSLGKAQSLHILIEKEFPCQHQPDEENQDTFGELAGDQMA
jgi:hypothetical protein